MSVDDVYLTHWITLSQQIPRHSFFLTEENEFVHALEMELKAINLSKILFTVINKTMLPPLSEML